MERCSVRKDASYLVALISAYVLVLWLIPSGSAQDADKSQAPKPAKRTFLGVVTTAAPPSLRDYLDLKQGFGIQVVMVAEDSPAQSAGIEAGDVLTQINDQRLTTPEHLATLIRSLSSGVQTEVTYLRKGALVKVVVTLSEKEMSRPTHRRLILPQMPRPNASPEEWQRWQPHISKLQRPVPHHPNPGKPLSKDKSIVRIKNNLGSVVISNRNGQCRITISDQLGETVYDAPYSRQKGVQSLPQKARSHLEKMRVDQLGLLNPTK